MEITQFRSVRTLIRSAMEYSVILALLLVNLIFSASAAEVSIPEKTTPSSHADGIHHPFGTVAAIQQYDLQAAVDLHNAAKHLQNQMDLYCAIEGHISPVRDAWRQLSLRWMHFQGREDTPLSVQPLVWHIQFWPDKKNTTGRKIQEMLESDNRYEMEEITQLSVAARGIGSLEWFLFDEASDLNSGLQCRAAMALSRDLANTTQHYSLGWEAPDWLEMSDKHQTAAHFAALSDQIAFVIKKLNLPLGTKGRANPYFSEAWRSEYSLMLLKQSVVQLQQYWLVAVKPAVVDIHELEMAQSIDIIFLRLLDSWPQGDSLRDLLGTPEGYRKGLAIRAQLQGIAEQLEIEIAPALGVTVGFNASDGD